MISAASDFTLEFAWLNQTLDNTGEIMSATWFWECQLWIDENSGTWPGNGENERNIIDITTMQEDYIESQMSLNFYAPKPLWLFRICEHLNIVRNWDYSVMKIIHRDKSFYYIFK